MDAVDASTPARRNLDRVTTRISAWLRLTSAVCCGMGAVLAFGAQARVDAVAVAVASLLLWSLVYCFLALRRSLHPALVLGDVMIVGCLCAAQPWLVAVERLPEGVGWVTPVTTVTIVSLLLRLPIGPAVPISTGLAALHVSVAAQLVGWPQMPGLAVTMALQIMLTTMVIELLRRVAQRADDAVARAARAASDAAASRARLAAAPDFYRMIHDNPLATLTMVAAGSFGPDTGVLRAQCHEDLATMRQLGGGDAVLTGPPVDLVTGLRDAVEDLTTPRFVVRLRSPDAVDLPSRVSDALLRCVRQALLNCRHHAGCDGAVVTVATDPQRPGVSVIVADDGSGFDVDAVAADRLGIRFSIIGLMHDIGGVATIRSRRGAGTEVELIWPA